MSAAQAAFKAARLRWAKNPEKCLRTLARRQPLPVVRIGRRDVPLVFTWFAVNPYGSSHVHSLLVTATEGQPGCARALAELVEVGSGGWIRAEDVMAGRVLVPYAIALSALSTAWNSYRQGASEPQPQRWWERVMRRPLRSLATHPTSQVV
ncbi:hypothetical protein [Brevundimonas nasdae]|uniref:hypothetical protein n=1 Tax=Brevundimonas nasdae TaxID=172043 RepID=UPI00301647CC